MAAEKSNQKTFNLSETVKVRCHIYNTRYSKGNKAKLYIEGEEKASKKITYYNRTWEAYTFQTILQSIVNSYKHFTKEEKEKYISLINNSSFSQDPDIFGSIKLASAVADLLINDKKKKNEIKVKAIENILGKSGVSFPDDWKELTEEEKEDRLSRIVNSIDKK